MMSPPIAENITEVENDETIEGLLAYILSWNSYNCSSLKFAIALIFFIATSTTLS